MTAESHSANRGSIPRRSTRLQSQPLIASGVFCCAGMVVVLLLACRSAAGAAPPFTVTITVDVSRPIGPLQPIWRFFGADEPNYAYMKDGRKLLGEIGRLSPGVKPYFRTHN